MRGAPHRGPELGSSRLLRMLKIGRGSDCAKMDALWRKRDGREFRVLSFRLLMMLKRLSNVIFSKSEYFVESKKDDGVTAVNRKFNFSKARIWVRALRDGDVIVENADVCTQRNSVSQSCSARLGVIRLTIRKFGRGSDFENIDARWRKRNGREFRLRSYRLLTRP
jgi:hypothetical protein